MPSMYVDEKSDEVIIPEKRPNKEGLPSAGGRGGKDLAQGERRRDGDGPDTTPGQRVERTHRRAPSGATEQECTVHCAAAPHHHRSPEPELPFA
jgi:hypothetical protein